MQSSEDTIVADVETLSRVADVETLSRRQSGVRYPGWLALFCIWTLIGVLAFARHYLDTSAAGRHEFSLKELAEWLTCFYPWVLFAPVVFEMERRFPLNRQQWKRSVPVLFVFALAVSFAVMKCTQILCLILNRKADLHAVLYTLSPGEWVLAFFLFWNVAAAGAIIRTFIHLERQQRVAAELALENAKLETSLKNAELEALRLRLKPHFLFNTLENISALAEDNPKLARRMLARLGELLRAAVRRDYQAEIRLDAEIALMNAYLDVERVRFGERLHVDVEVAPETETALVPSLLLQPLVENAIQHGLRNVSGAGWIEVTSRKSSEYLVLTIKDNGSGPPDEMALGIGLGSTRERLMRMYPQEHRLFIEKLQNGGTLVYIQLPFRTRNASSNGSAAHSYRG